jgi:DNA repair photolyase
MGLAQFAVNVGVKCGHDCPYCSTGALMRMHHAFRRVAQSPFGLGYSIVDPDVPERVARHAQRMTSRGVVQLRTIVDAWAPEAQTHDLGRRCLQALLPEPGWVVRILTKNAAVQRDFDVVEKHRDRVLVGLSLPGTCRSWPSRVSSIGGDGKRPGFQ